MPWLQGQQPLEDNFSDISMSGNWARIIIIYLLCASGATAAVLFMVRRLETALNRSESLYVALKEEAERRLTELQQRRHLERQMNDSARMAALGRVAGGIAHDFNNLLQIISSNAEIASATQNDSVGRESILDLRQACDSAIRLTEQMLTVGGNRAGGDRSFERGGRAPLFYETGTPADA